MHGDKRKSGVTRCLGEGASGVIVLGARVSVRGDVTILDIDSGDG